MRRFQHRPNHHESKFIQILLLTMMAVGIMGCQETNTNVAVVTSVTPPAQTQPIVKVGLPDKNLPPYFFYKGRFTREWDDDGIEQNIIQVSFENAGYQPEFVYLSDRKQEFQNPKSTLDCISTIVESDKIKGYYSKAVITYTDVVIFLADQRPPINTLKDLLGQQVESFNQAGELYPEIAVLSKDLAYYHEHRSRTSQVILLYRKKVRALIMDEYMFYFSRYWAGADLIVDTSPPCEIRHWFKPHPYQIVCKTPKIRDGFNQGLDKLHQDRQKQAIIKLYMDRYNFSQHKACDSK